LSRDTLERFVKRSIPAHVKCWGETRTTRKPRLLFRFAASFLFRLAERHLLASLFHEPPRTTRRLDHAPQTTSVLLSRSERSLPLAEREDYTAV
jgi:hypothetical protein